MGKRVRGAKLRSKKRGAEFEKEIVETQAVQAEEGAVTEKADEELFVLDTTAVVPSKKQLAKKEKKEKREKTVSAKEQSQIQKLVETHSAKQLEAMAKQTSITAKRAPKTIKMKKSRPTFDIWVDEEDTNPKKRKASAIVVSSGPHGIVPSTHVKIGTTRALPAQAPKNKAKMPVNVDLAKSGQSYNPDGKDHKKAIEEALKVETKREKAEREAKESASQGMSEETKALLLGDTDSEDEEDSDDEDKDSGDETKVAPEKRPEKMTRAQRNKQKRIRAEQWEIQERKRQKRLQHELRGVKAAGRKLKKEEEERRAAKEKMEQLKLEGERSKGKDIYLQLADENPRYAPTYPVALPGELKSGASLRTIKPKGSLVTDRMVSLMDRDMTAKKQLKLKKRVEGKRRKLKVRGKGYRDTKEGDILG
jgi:nucleolar protein 53